MESLASKTIGYCGADLKGLCAEAALNALRRRYPQVYKTNQKLALKIDEIVIKEADFQKAMRSMVPSTHRIQGQNQSPLPISIRPLLNQNLAKIKAELERIFWDGKEVNSNFRPRLLICGEKGQGLTTYLAPAVLHYLEKFPCHKLDIPAIFSNSVRSPEEALLHIIHEAKRTIPSVLYMPYIDRLWMIMSDSARETFLSLLADVPPKASLLIIAVAESVSVDNLPDNLFLKDNNVRETFNVENPTVAERTEFFKPVFQAAAAPVPDVYEPHVEEAEENLEVLPPAECRQLTEKEEKRMRKKEEKLRRELRIFLR